MDFKEFFERIDDDLYDNFYDSFPDENSDSTPKQDVPSRKSVSKASEVRAVETFPSSGDQESNLNRNDMSPLVCENKHGSPSRILKAVDNTTTNSYLNIEENSFLNIRFIPGYVEERRKRIFPGPAGLKLGPELSWYNLEMNRSFRRVGEAVKIKNIINFQFEDEKLLLPSWRHLQEDVSASEDLLSIAKYYSIHRVFSETKFKRLPKHIIVPVLCVLLKTLMNDDSVSVFIDDTGKITGNIDKEVLSMFKEYLKDGVSLILKEVTFLCGLLLLTKENLVSIYFEDGTVKQVQGMDSMPLIEKPLKSVCCTCEETPRKKAFGNKPLLNNTCTSPIDPQKHNRKRNNSATSNDAVTKRLSSNQRNPNYPTGRIPSCSSLNFSASPRQGFLDSSNSVTDVLNKMHNIDNIKGSAVVSSPQNEQNGDVFNHVSGRQNNLSNHQNQIGLNNSIFDTSEMKINNLEERNRTDENHCISDENFEVNNMFGGNSEMDEFDKLMGNLDERSFLEEM